MIDQKIIDFGKELIALAEKYSEPRVVSIRPEKEPEPCKHEPIVFRNLWNNTGPVIIHDADNIKCKHCGVKIKAEKWITDEKL